MRACNSNMLPCILGEIILDSDQHTVDEDVGSLNVCFTTNRRFCLNLTSHGLEAGNVHA